MSTITVYIGFMGAGKGYQTQKLINENPNYVKVSFADSLRELTYAFLGIEKPLDYDLWKVQKATINLNGRQVLQNVGSALRNYDPEFFVKRTVKTIKTLLSEGKDVVIDDCRYQNELEALHNLVYLHNLDLNVIYCDYKSPRYRDDDLHESEILARSYKKLGYKDLDVIYIAKNGRVISF